MIFFVNSAYQRCHRCLDLTVVVFHTFVLICQLNLSFSLCERRSYERFLGYFALHLYSKTKTFMELALQFSWTLSITGSGTDALLVPDRHLILQQLCKEDLFVFKFEYWSLFEPTYHPPKSFLSCNLKSNSKPEMSCYCFIRLRQFKIRVFQCLRRHPRPRDKNKYGGSLQHYFCHERTMMTS